MTRRLVLVIAGVVAATLLIAGLGTLVLAHARARLTTEAELREEAQAVSNKLVALFEDTDSRAAPAIQIRQIQQVAALLQLDTLGVIALNSTTAPVTVLPTGLEPDDIGLSALGAGQVTSGRKGDLVFAAAPIPTPGRRIAAVVIAERAGSGLGSAGRYFLLASAATLLLGIVAALVLGRRLTTPVRRASDVAERISGGDLSARLPDTGHGRSDELTELGRNLNAMAATLARSRDLEQQFLMSVSHDLRTPLTSIRGYADAIADGTAPPAEGAAVISAQAKRLERLVADLLDLAKLQASSFSLSNEVIDAGALAEVCVDGFRPDAEERGLTIAVHAAPRQFVRADHDRLSQVISNLIENALKFATDLVVVSVESEDGAVAISVRDDGPGIAAADLPHVFERLYVARRQPPRKESSSGLGLAIARDLAAAMGATVSARTPAGGGTEMTVRFPPAFPPGFSPPSPASARPPA